MDGLQRPVFATPKIEFDDSVLRGEQTNADTAKDTISTSNEAVHNSESGEGWSRPSVTTSGHECGLEDRISPESAFPAIESKLSAAAMKLLAGETECAAFQGGARGDGNGTGGFSTRDRNGSTIAIDSRVLGTAQEHQTEAQRPPTEVATRPVYLNPMTGMLVLGGQSIGAVSRGQTTGAESQPAGHGAVAEPSGNGALRDPPASDVVVKEHESVGGELNKSTDSRGAGAADPTTTSSAYSNGLDMACMGESKTNQATEVERKSSRSSSSLDLEDFWRDGSDTHQSAGTARSGNDQSLSLTFDYPTNDDRGRSSMTEAAIASSVMPAGTIEPAALQRPVSMGGPARYVAVVDSRSVQIDMQEQAHGILVGGDPSAERASAAPVQSENSSTRDPASSLARGRARPEGPAGLVPEQDGGCSPEDTVDVARAAVSYAIAASASSFPNFDSKYADSRGEAAPSNTIGELAIREALVSETATMPNRRTDTDSSKESNSSLTASTTMRTGEGSTEGNSSRGEITSRDSEAALYAAGDTVAVTSASGLVNAPKRKCRRGVASTAKRRSSRRKYSSEDIMLEMCMICLEKLSDATEGGGQKTLGLIDSCSHRYCYTCILEWSKVTNKCPQCKHRFHTIKAVKELRRNHGSYRGVAVSVEDRDQKYSFVDVRDVVVLDPEVRCYASCLLRGAVDALRQSGWEFSVQCEQCSEWFHGLCIGFREESAVPDLWLCQACRSLPPQALDQHSTRGRGSNVSGVRRGTFSSRGRVRGRAQGNGPSAGQDRPRHPVLGQDGGAQEVGDGTTTSQSRNTLALRRSVSTPVEEAGSACPQQVLPITTASSSSPVRTLSTLSGPQAEGSTTNSRGRGRKRKTRRSPSTSPPPPQAQVSMEPDGQERGRPPLSQTTPVLTSQATPPVEQESADVTASVPPLSRRKGKRRRSQSAAAEVPPMRGRSSTRLAQTSLVSPQSVPELARGKPRPSNTTSSPSPATPMSGMPPSSLTSAAISWPDLPTLAMSSHVLTTPSPVVPASAVPAPTIRLATTPASEVQATAELETAPGVQGSALLATAAASATPLPGTPVATDPVTTVSAQAVPLQSMPGPATAAATVFSPTVSATVASMTSVRAPQVQVVSSTVPVPATLAPAVLSSVVPAPSEVAPTVAGLSLPMQALPSAAIQGSAVPAPVTPVPAVPTQTLPPPAKREGSTKLSETLPSSPSPIQASGGPASSDTPGAALQHQYPFHARVQWEPHIKLEGDCGTQASVHQGRRDGSCNITVRPKLPQTPALPWLQSLEAPQATELCDICGFDTERDNLIVYCESCHMGVHQTCYGISKIPTKEWYCSPCSAGVHPSTLSCRFCPLKGGALKRCTDGSWGHILCAFWIPECCFLDPDKMEPIGSINKRGEASQVERFLPPFRSRKCYICGTTAGCVIRCHSSSCKFHLHPMCGSKAGSVYMEIETMMKTGSDGKEYESVSLVARCPRHDKRKIGINHRDRKSRGLVSTADPLGVAGRTLELKDPGREDGTVLNGKVTWFDSVRSRYCVVESSSDSGTGSGDTTKGLAHWIAADKLVEVEAVCTQTKKRERFVVKQPASAKDGVRESKSEDKTQEEGGTTSSCQEDTERAQKQADDSFDKSLNSEKNDADENSQSSSGKCCKRDELGVLGPSEAPSSKCANFETQTRTGTPSRCDSKTLSQEQAHASQVSSSGELDQTCLKMTESTSKGGATSTSAMQTGEGESDVVVPAEEQRRKDRLPAVQIIDPGHSWRRYSTRGRKREQPDAAPDHDLDIVPGFILSKKVRLAEQDEEGGKPSTNDPVASQNSNKLGPETASDNVPSVPEVPAAQRNDEVLSSGQTIEEQPSTEVWDKRYGLSVTGPVEMETVSTEVRDTRGEIGATGPIEPDMSSTWMDNTRDKIGTAGHVEPETISTEVVDKSEIGAVRPQEPETSSMEMRDKRGEVGATEPVESETASTEVRDTRGEIGAAGPIEPEMSSTWMMNKRGKIGTAGHVAPDTPSTEVVDKSDIGAAGPQEPETTSMEMRDKMGEVGATEPVESETASTEVRDTRGEIGATGSIEPDMSSTWMDNTRDKIGTAGHVEPETPSTEVVDKSKIGAAGPQEPETTSMKMRDKRGEVGATEPAESETASTDVRDTRGEIGAVETVEPACTEVRGKRTEMGKTEPIASEPVKDPLAPALRPGWPSGMTLLGQVPVMRIHTFHVARGPEIKYFACGSADAKSVIYDQYSTPRLSFRFEDLEEIRASRPREQIHHVRPVTDVATSMNRDCLEWAHMENKIRQEKRQMNEMRMNREFLEWACMENKISQEKRQMRDGSNTRRQGNPLHRGDQHLEEQSHREKDEGAVRAVESDAESDASSPPSLDDFSEMEDGEIETLTDGRAKVMPCSPLDRNMGSVKKMARMEPEGGLVGDASRAEVEDETASGHLAGGNSVRGGEKWSDSEDMEISSDCLSMGEEDQEETGSLISSDGEIVDEGDDPVANSSSDSKEALERVDMRDRTAADKRADRTKPIGPGSACVQTVNNARATVPPGDVSEDFAWSTSAPQERMAVPAAVQKTEQPQPDDHLREIVRRNLEIRLSAGKVEDGAIVNRNRSGLFNRIAADVEAELFQRLYREKDKGHEYKAKYKQLLLSLGNTRNHRLVDSVLAGTTTPADLATKDAVGLLKSLNSSLNCEAVPLTGRNGQSNRRGKMVLLG